MAPLSLSRRPQHVPLLSALPTVARALHAWLTDSAYLRDDATHMHTLAKRDGPKGGARIAFIILIPVCVLLSGLFAGLTLGYMSLDETQLNVLSVSGTPKQQAYAKKIMPIRKNGHLLLVTLLLANMIVNEALPVISDPIFHGGVQSVVISTALIVIFSEIIPQAVCTRYGLAIGATMAGPTRVLILIFGIISWPVAKLLEFILGPHGGIMYRRSELKELINMHAASEAHGGDLKKDTVNIIGATLDLEVKTAEEAMTDLADVFMLPIDAKLDRPTLKKICDKGHSRVPVYEEVNVPHYDASASTEGRTKKAKKIIGILLVKHCVMLDPDDATPLRSIQLNRVVFVPRNESLLGILDRFQEGRSHIAVVTRFTEDAPQEEEAQQEVKKGFAQRLKDTVGIGESSSESSDSEDEEKGSDKKKRKEEKANGTLNGNGNTKMQSVVTLNGQEQAMPADAVLDKKGQRELLRSVDPAVGPLGIITLEDVLEEMIGEEIYDEFDQEGASPDLYHTEPEKKQPASGAPAPSARASIDKQQPQQPSQQLKPEQPAVRRGLSGRGLSFFNVRAKSLPPDSSPRSEVISQSQPGTPRIAFQEPGQMQPVPEQAPAPMSRLQSQAKVSHPHPHGRTGLGPAIHEHRKLREAGTANVQGGTAGAGSHQHQQLHAHGRGGKGGRFKSPLLGGSQTPESHVSPASGSGDGAEGGAAQDSAAAAAAAIRTNAPADAKGDTGQTDSPTAAEAPAGVEGNDYAAGS